MWGQRLLAFFLPSFLLQGLCMVVYIIYPQQHRITPVIPQEAAGAAGSARSASPTFAWSGVLRPPRHFRRQLGPFCYATCLTVSYSTAGQPHSQRATRVSASPAPRSAVVAALLRPPGRRLEGILAIARPGTCVLSSRGLVAGTHRLTAGGACGGDLASVWGAVSRPRHSTQSQLSVTRKAGEPASRAHGTRPLASHT